MAGYKYEQRDKDFLNIAQRSNIKLQGDDVMSFRNKWVETLMRFDPVKMPSDDDKLQLLEIQISQSKKRDCAYSRVRSEPHTLIFTGKYTRSQNAKDWKKCPPSEGLLQRLQIRPSPGEILAEIKVRKGMGVPAGVCQHIVKHVRCTNASSP